MYVYSIKNKRNDLLLFPYHAYVNPIFLKISIVNFKHL